MRKLVKITEHNHEKFEFNVNEDPVRGELPLDFRLSSGRSVYVLATEFYESAICVAFTEKVPTTVDELDYLTNEDGSIAVFYTVWSKVPRAGRELVFAVSDYIKEQFPHIERCVTLSPKTKMAYRFHISNGAKLIQKNTDTDNYEYFINNTEA